MEEVKLRVVEVGPRDGLQNEPRIKALPQEELAEVRFRFVTSLADAGLKDVEAGAFVRADRVPQMAATDRVLRLIQERRPDLWKTHRFWVLVPNAKGLELALAAGARHVSVFTATSDAFNERNVGMTVKDSLRALEPVMREAVRARLKVRGYVSTVWGCPYSGAVSPQKARSVAGKLLDSGAEEISLGDTVGIATPNKVRAVLRLFHGKKKLAVHFHDTRGTAIANCLEAVQHGIRVVDSSAGGLGGCPYAVGASGNLATEDLLYMAHGMGFRTGVDLEKVCLASERLARDLEVTLPSRYHKAWKGMRRE
ncbi:MAG: hydroxymethylglutaryl-CoA lyase [Bdellovibrionales bacterium]|nr:hydroxymethylglutaryl-CoA lyase [Bdellovibrionales bacterium]